jgi:hypothetical protein
MIIIRSVPMELFSQIKSSQIKAKQSILCKLNIYNKTPTFSWSFVVVLKVRTVQGGLLL